jgi:hypothetical protein
MYAYCAAHSSTLNHRLYLARKKERETLQDALEEVLGWDWEQKAIEDALEGLPLLLSSQVEPVVEGAAVGRAIRVHR